MTLKEMVDMKLNEGKRIELGLWLLRVPGGWTYNYLDDIQTRSCAVFVPLPSLVPMSPGVDFLEKRKE